VSPGWDQGLVGMQTGGERILTCPPNFAYGKKGSKPDIPSNATLVFGMSFILSMTGMLITLTEVKVLAVN